MAVGLRGNQVKNSFDAVLNISGEGQQVDGTLRPVVDGSGNTTAMVISTDKIGAGSGSTLVQGGVEVTAPAAGLNRLPDASALKFTKTDSPSAAATGDVNAYVDSNGIPYTVDENGVRNNILTGSGWTPAGGYDLDGTDDYILRTNDSNLDFGTSDFFIEFQSLGVGTIISYGRKSSTSGASLAGIYSGMSNVVGLRISLGDNASGVRVDENVTPAIDADRLYHIVISGDRDTGISVYLDGKLSYSGTGNYGDFTALGSIASAFNLYIGCGYDVHTFLDGNLYLLRWGNRTLTQAEVIEHYNNGRPDLYRLPYADIGASQTALVINATDDMADDDTANWTDVNGALTFDTDHYVYTVTTGASVAGTYVACSGLNIGKNYKWAISATQGTGAGATLTVRVMNNARDTVLATTDLVLSASEQSTFVEWEATEANNVVEFYLAANEVGDGETFLLSGSAVNRVGCVLELLPENMGRLGAIETMNGSHGSTSGNPIALSAEQRPLIYRDVKLSIANTATTLTNIVPPGYMIESIRAKASASVTAVKIGTSSGGQEVVASSTAGTTPTILTLAATAHDGYSESASVTLYAEHATAGETLDLIFTFRRAG